jgi:hypothetical protein
MNEHKSFLKRSVWYFFAGFLGMAVMFAAPSVAKADQIVITVTSDGDTLPPGVSDTITVTDIMGGNVLPVLTVQESDEVGGVTFFNHIAGFNWLTPNTLFVTEGVGGPTSDIVTLTNQGNDAFIYFTSDDDSGNLGSIPIEAAQQTLPEGAGGGTFTTTQTVNAAVPEPGSLILFATVLGASVIGVRRKTLGR